MRLVDYENVDRNSFSVANQWTISENSERRPDVVVFLNGLPVVVFELKSPSREETDASEAYLQLRNYMHEIPSLFTYNAFLVMSDLAVSKAGTITSDEDRFMEWKTKMAAMRIPICSLTLLLNFRQGATLRHYQELYLFSGDVKIMAAYHQYFAVRKASLPPPRQLSRMGKVVCFGTGQW